MTDDAGDGKRSTSQVFTSRILNDVALASVLQDLSGSRCHPNSDEVNSN